MRRTAGLVLTYQGQLAEGALPRGLRRVHGVGRRRLGRLGAVPHRRAPTTCRRACIGSGGSPCRSNNCAPRSTPSPRSEVGRTLDRDRRDRAGLRRPREPASRVVRRTRPRAPRRRAPRRSSTARSARAPSRARSSPCRATAPDVVFSGTGFGHGVGLCQVGAADRAKRGDRSRPSSATTSRGTRREALKGSAGSPGSAVRRRADGTGRTRRTRRTCRTDEPTAADLQ